MSSRGRDSSGSCLRTSGQFIRAYSGDGQRQSCIGSNGTLELLQPNMPVQRRELLHTAPSLLSQLQLGSVLWMTVHLLQVSFMDSFSSLPVAC